MNDDDVRKLARIDLFREIGRKYMLPASEMHDDHPVHE